MTIGDLKLGQTFRLPGNNHLFKVIDFGPIMAEGYEVPESPRQWARIETPCGRTVIWWADMPIEESPQLCLFCY